MTPSLRGLIRQAVGQEPPAEQAWEDLGPPESELLPSIASLIPRDRISAKARGLKKYTWLRYQLCVSEARKIYESAPESLLLIDDLNLILSCYPGPSYRAITGIDFLVRPDSLIDWNSKLTALGWQKPPWGDPVGTACWVGKESLMLRLHERWLEHWCGSWDFVFRESVIRDGMASMADSHQLCRVFLQGQPHLQFLDAHYLLAKSLDFALALPRPFDMLCGRWSQRFEQATGVSTGLCWRSPATLAEWALKCTDGHLDLYRRMIGELALELSSCGEAGWPGQWTQAVCRRWSLSSPREIPRELWQRLRGDRA